MLLTRRRDNGGRQRERLAGKRAGERQVRGQPEATGASDRLVKAREGCRNTTCDAIKTNSCAGEFMCICIARPACGAVIAHNARFAINWLPRLM